MRSSNVRGVGGRALVPAALLFLLGAALLGLGAMDSGALAEAVDRRTVGGSDRFLPPAFVWRAQVRMLVAGVGLWILAAVALVPRLGVGRFLGEALWDVLSLPGRLVRAVRDLHARETVHVLLVGLAAALALVLGISRIDQAVHIDEATTFLEYVRQPFAILLLRYDSANNHVLHSLAARLAQLAFGPDTWSLRLPALVAGALRVPAAYAAARALFGRAAAVPAAFTVATWPYLVDLSANARGYTMVDVAFLSLLALLPGLVSAPSRVRWTAFAVTTALGLFAVPILLFPLTGIALFFVWRVFAGLPPGERGARLRGFVAAGSSALALTAGLYLPALLFTNQRMRAPMVKVAQWEAAQPFPSEWKRLVTDTASWWTFGLPLPAIAVVASLFLVGCLRAWPFVASFALGLAAVGLATAPPPPWSASWGLLVLLLVACAGLTRLAGLLGRHAPLATALVLALGCGLSLRTGLRHPDRVTAPWYLGPPDAHDTASVVAELAREGRPAILGVFPDVRYYAHLQGSPDLDLHEGLDGLDGYDAVYLVEPRRPPRLARAVAMWREQLTEQGFTRVTLVRELAGSSILSLSREED